MEIRSLVLRVFSDDGSSQTPYTPTSLSQIATMSPSTSLRVLRHREWCNWPETLRDDHKECCLHPPEFRLLYCVHLDAQDVHLNAPHLSPVGPCYPYNTLANTLMKHIPVPTHFHSLTPVVSSRYPSAVCGPCSLRNMESSEWPRGFVDMWCAFPIRSTRLHTKPCCACAQRLYGFMAAVVQ